MFPRHHRLPLRQREDFFSSAKRKYSTHLSAFYQLSEGESLGVIVVPKKVSPKATVRNRLKRQLRAHLLPLLMHRAGIQVMIVAKKEALDLESNVVKEELITLIGSLE